MPVIPATWEEYEIKASPGRKLARPQKAGCGGMKSQVCRKPYKGKIVV
jgi:hypothetical protein